MATINFPTSPTTGQVYNANTKAWTYTGYGWKAVNAAGSLVSSNVITYTATAGQTSFTTPTYVQGANQVSIFINGVRQNPSEFAESTNTTITLTNGATLSDNVLIQVEGYTGNPIVIGLPTILNDTVTNATRYPLMAQSTSGSLTLVNTASTEFTFNPSTNVLFVPNLQFNDGTTISTSFAAAGSYANSAYAQANGASIYANGAFIQANAAFIKANTPTHVANSASLYANGAFIQANAAFNTANNSAPATITDDTTNNLTLYPLLSLSSSGNLSKANTSTTKLSFNPSTGALTATSFVGVFPTGTLMLFQQTAAPTGWTKQITHDNKALRVVSGAASSGGTTSFTSVFASRTPAGTVGATTLTAAQSGMPAHGHTITDPTHFHAASMGTTDGTAGRFDSSSSGQVNTVNTAAAATGITINNATAVNATESHTHGFTGTAMDFSVQYVDLIIASKD